MFKIISAIFSTGVAVGAAGVLIAIRRGHMHLEPNTPDTVYDEQQTESSDDSAAADNGATAAEVVDAQAERLGS